MAVNTRGMRKVKFRGKQYLWQVKERKPVPPEEGFITHPPAERILHIISSDKRFIVHYRIPEPGDPHTDLRIEGPLFPRAPHQKEIEVPRWRHDSKRYPTADFVRRLIGWCMEPEN